MIKKLPAFIERPKKRGIGEVPELPVIPVMTPPPLSPVTETPGFMVTTPPMPPVVPPPGPFNFSPMLPPPPLTLPGFTQTGMPGIPGTTSQENITRGKTAFDQLTAKHTLFRGGILAIDASDINRWYGENASSLEALLQIALPIDVNTMAGLRDWLWQTDQGRKFSPSEMVTIIKLKILQEKTSFPEIELPARIYRFLKKVIRPGVAQVLFLMKQKDALRGKEFDAVKILFKASAAVSEAKAMTYTSEQGKILAEAEGNEAIAQRAVNEIRSQIDLLSDQIDIENAREYTDEELFNFLISKSDDPSLRNDLEKYKANLANVTSLLKPGMDEIALYLAKRGAIVDRVAAIRADLPLMKSGVVTGTYSQTDVDTANESIRINLKLMEEFTAHIETVEAQNQKIREANPDVFDTKALKPIDMQEYVSRYLTKMTTDKEDVLIEILSKVMSDNAAAADSLMAGFLTNRATDIAVRQKEFDNYFQAQAEVKLKYYTDQISVVQKEYNALADVLQKEFDGLMNLQTAITRAVSDLGDVMGWWCHEKGLTSDDMAKPYFINVALQSIVNVRGKYDIVAISAGPVTVNQTFWPHPWKSYDVAAQALSDMQTLSEKQADYETGSGAAIRAQLDSMYKWMSQLHDAYEVTYQYVNSPDFVKEIIRRFKASPEQANTDASITDIAVRLRDIQALTQYEQELLVPIIDDLEEQKLADHGIKVPDTKYYDYEKKKNVWVGVIGYLEKALSQYQLLVDTLAEIKKRVSANIATDDDAQAARLIQVAIFNIMGGELIYRRLDRDSEFKIIMLKDAEDNEVSDLNTVREA